MTIEIPLSKQGTKYKGLYFAIVDDCDAILGERPWSAIVKSNTVYAKQSDVKKGAKGLHQVILETMLGHPLKKGEMVDHIDGNGLNCTRGNLRRASASQNQANQKLSKNNKTGLKGVSWKVRDKKYIAQIQFKRKNYHIGSFDSPEEAKAAYDKKALELFGEFANFG
jgi:hypothetical protein